MRITYQEEDVQFDEEGGDVGYEDVEDVEDGHEDKDGDN